MSSKITEVWSSWFSLQFSLEVQFLSATDDWVIRLSVSAFEANTLLGNKYWESNTLPGAKTEATQNIRQVVWIPKPKRPVFVTPIWN